LKRTRLKNRSKTSSAKLQRKLWELCKQLTRLKYGNECYTCNQKNLVGCNWQTGHFLPKGSCGSYLKYDLRNLRPQCMRCNLDLGGNGAEFMRRMIVREGQDYVDQLFKDKLLILSGKQSYEHYEMLLEKYKLMLEEV
jgi:hypothetical protein